MAEKIVSPGVFTKENDMSFVQSGVGAIGAAWFLPKYLHTESIKHFSGTHSNQVVITTNI